MIIFVQRSREGELHLEVATNNLLTTVSVIILFTFLSISAKVITGYRVRNGVWTLLGKGDPQAPQVKENIACFRLHLNIGQNTCFFFSR